MTSIPEPENLLVKNEEDQQPRAAHRGESVSALGSEERTLTDQKLRIYEYFFNNNQDMACIANMAGYFEIVNPNFNKLLGYSEKELTEKQFLEFVHPDDVQATLNEIEKLKTGAITLNFVNRYRKKDGDYLWFEWSTTPEISTGKLFAIARDITRRKKTEAELREKALFIKDNEERINRVLEILLKYTMMDFSHRVEISEKNDELDAISLGLNSLAEELDANILALKEKEEKQSQLVKELNIKTGQIERKNLLLSGIASMNDTLRGIKDLPTLAQDVIKMLIPFLNANIGNVYIKEEGTLLRWVAGNDPGSKNNHPDLCTDEGLIGQAALKKKSTLFAKIPENYLASCFCAKCHSVPKNMIVVPLWYAGILEGVIGICTPNEFSGQQMEFLDLVADAIAISFNAARTRSQMSELLEETKRQAKELEEINRYKSEFLSTMSHELRTPLNSILILSELLFENKNKKLGRKEIEYAKNIQGSGTELLKLINEVLDLSKIESGKMEIEPEKISLTGIVQKMKSMFSEVAKNKAIEFVICHDRKQAVDTIFSDRQRLEQILRNLLSNAFKFTSKGGRVTLTIISENKRRPTSTQQQLKKMLAFIVEDTGIGVPAGKHNLIFEPFRQADSSTKRKYGGTGMGLSISRNLAHLLGGEIHLQSEENRGSRFTLYLPVGQSLRQKYGVRVFTGPGTGNKSIRSGDARPSGRNGYLHPIRKQKLSDGKLKGRTVLLADDDIRNVYALVNVLDGEGMKYLIAENGKDVLKILNKNPDIEIILMDLMMPEMDGFETTAAIRKMNKFKNIPILALTAKAMKGTRDKCLQAGMNDYIAKPVHISDLLSLMKLYLNPSNHEST